MTNAMAACAAAALAGSLLCSCTRPAPEPAARPAVRSPELAPQAAEGEIRALRAQLAQAQAQRDDAIARLNAALLRERALEARLRAAAPPPAPVVQVVRPIAAPRASPVRAPQTFESLTTKPAATP